MTKVFDSLYSPEQVITDTLTRSHRINLVVKREDLNHAVFPGNKLRKLKYNFLHAEQSGATAIISFGGAYSNHILALSAAGKMAGLPTIGIIRGEELVSLPLNPVLQQARKNGMHLEFISREEYRHRNEHDYREQLQSKWRNACIIPEGGSNQPGIKGVSEIIHSLDHHYDFIVSPCGTGGTLAGIIQGIADTGRVNTVALGISVLKNSNQYLQTEVRNLLKSDISDQINWEINNDYHFGGYAKSTPQLSEFIACFQRDHTILLDPVYTGKTFFAVYALIKSGYFPKDSSVLLVHTGGLQTMQICRSFSSSDEQYASNY